MKNILIFLFLGILIATPAYSQNKKAKKTVNIPSFSAKSFLVADIDGHVFKEQDSNSIRPIASITKLMVALLAADQDLEEFLPIPDKRQFTTIIPRNIKYLTRRELLTLSLVRSDNFASYVLCNHIDDCIDKMNSTAQSLGMTDSKFTDATGLDNGNVSTANDLLKLIILSHQNPTIVELSSLPIANISVGKQNIRINNTNPLTWKHHILLSKTGFTRAAGGCLIMVMDSDMGKRILILLGSKNVFTRITEMERLVKDL